MNPFNVRPRRSSLRPLATAAAALGLFALSACGSTSNSDVNPPQDTSFGTVAPVDNSSNSNTPAAPGDTTAAGSMTPGGVGTTP